MPHKFSNKDTKTREDHENLSCKITWVLIVNVLLKKSIPETKIPIKSKFNPF